MATAGRARAGEQAGGSGPAIVPGAVPDGVRESIVLGISLLAGQRSKLLPPWFVALTYVAAVVMIFAFAFIPLVLLPIWGVGSAVVLARPSAPPVAQA